MGVCTWRRRSIRRLMENKEYKENTYGSLHLEYKKHEENQ